MATKNFVPRRDGEGSIGKASKHWDKGYFRELIINGKALQDFVKELGIESSQTAEQAGWIKFGNGVLVQWRHAQQRDKEIPYICEYTGCSVALCAHDWTLEIRRKAYEYQKLSCEI